MQRQREALIDAEHERYVTTVYGAWPAMVAEAAGAALRPSDRAVGLNARPSDRLDDLKTGKRRSPSVIWDLDNCAVAGMNFQANRRATKGLRVEPPAEAHLPKYLGVLPIGDTTADLRVADHVSNGFSNEEVRLTDDLAGTPIQRGSRPE